MAMTCCAKVRHVTLQSTSSRWIALRQVPTWIEQRGGKRVSAAAVHRWRLHGIRGHRLQAWKVGGTYHTTQEELLRFFAALTEVAT